MAKRSYLNPKAGNTVEQWGCGKGNYGLASDLLKSSCSRSVDWFAPILNRLHVVVLLRRTPRNHAALWAHVHARTQHQRSWLNMFVLSSIQRGQNATGITKPTNDLTRLMANRLTKRTVKMRLYARRRCFMAPSGRCKAVFLAALIVPSHYLFHQSWLPESHQQSSE